MRDRRITVRMALLVPMLLGTFAGIWAQERNASSIAGSVASPAIPIVTFTLDFPISAPSHYSVRVAQDGKASYESMGKLTPEADGDPFLYSFMMSEANRTRIFELAEQAKFFDGNFDYKKGRLANTGKKVLAYEDGKVQHETVYNYSTNSAIQQLTTIFQNISATMEFARRVQYFHKYQPLAVEEELKRMEDMAKTHSLDEVQAVAPVLQEIAEDKAVLNVTRSRAVRLLGK